MSENKTDHEFQAGVEVALMSGGWGIERPTKRVVAKVYKTGNFLLEGSDQQWRVGFSKGTARHAGESGWRGSTLEIWTSKHDEMLGAAARYDQWQDALRKIVKTKVDPTPEMISAIQDVVAMIEGAEQ